MPPTPGRAPERPARAGEQGPEQLALMAEPVRSARAGGRGASGGRGARHRSGPLEPAYLAETDPVARVRLESHLPHLDRLFDYGVPQDLSEGAQAGTRIRVRFGGQQMRGWIIERSASSEVAFDRLQPILSLQSALPVLVPQVLAVAELTAQRCAGTVADVLRCAVPPRVASVEKAALAARDSTGASAAVAAVNPGAEQRAGHSGAEEAAEALPDAQAEADPETAAHRARPLIAAEPAAPSAWSEYVGGREAIEALRGGQRVRAVVQALPSHPEHDLYDLIAQAVAAALESGRGSVVVVPDHKTLERAQRAVEVVVEPQLVARLHSEDKPTPRYRAFVQALEGHARVVIGTRPAVWAPVEDLGLIVVVDDGDHSLVEPRAPYHHARDVALLRAQHDDLGLLVTGQAVTPEAERLVETGWASSIAAQRPVLRANMPRIESTSDSWHEAHDPLAGRARLPETAFRVARRALADGPVLVQVARTGYAPSLTCQRCRNAARCTVCDGPLSVPARGRLPQCGWCARQAANWSCGHCGATQWRFSSVGSERTAEELGRAFPQVPVIWSSGDQVRREIPAAPALVVATPGAEPQAEGGYAAALLLDGDRMLSRPGLRVEEEVLRKWVHAASLVRRGSAGGTVVVTSEHERVVASLVRWDLRGHAARELAERRTLQLPPAVRCAALTGPLPALEAFLELVDLPDDVRTVGPAPVHQRWDEEAEDPQSEAASADVLGGLPDDDEAHRLLLFFTYSQAAEVTRRLRAARAEASAQRKHAPVNVRCDVADLL
ncbi:primosomal protein N' family DNA-binding protein [Kocuria palustris]|uniref:primosomal protein N' family DNA-binding protein n=1 Tax=Kocuria palustris TaxID=71999 RepID=UPI0021A76BF6|nr:primosomal protein N' [Kocuria palustris]MCT1589733.1 primosomal protein N' [Kocuria palustris]